MKQFPRLVKFEADQTCFSISSPFLLSSRFLFRSRSSFPLASFDSRRLLPVDIRVSARSIFLRTPARALECAVGQRSLSCAAPFRPLGSLVIDGSRIRGDVKAK